MLKNMQVTLQSASSEGKQKDPQERKEPLYKLRGNERRQVPEIWPTGMSPRRGTGGLAPVYIIIIITWVSQIKTVKQIQILNIAPLSYKLADMLPML
jgi:hypothetical protein